MAKRSSYRLFFFVAILLLLAASRIVRFNSMEMHVDEIWSIWQTFGTPEQVILRTPYDWTPLYYVLLGGWKEVAGIHPFALRTLSLFIFLVGSAALYRVTRWLRDEPTALLAVLAFGALGYSIRISTEVRAYMLMVTLLILAFWFTLRYFRRPVLRRAIPLAVCMALMFYTYMPSVIGYLMLGVYTLVVYRKTIWHWWLPGGLAALLALPIILYKIPQFVERVNSPRVEPTFAEAFSDYFRQYTVYLFPGYPLWLWLLLAILATALIIRYWRAANRHTVALTTWTFALPVLLFILNPVFKFFDQHYAMALMVGIAMWLAWGLRFLPHRGRLLAGGVLAVLMLLPVQLQYNPLYFRPWMATFEWLQTNMQWGDVILIDSGCCDGHWYEWDYATRLYFPNGLDFVTEPAGHRRVWYVFNNEHYNTATREKVTTGRLERAFYGTAGFMFRLYEQPPDLEGIPFANGMRFHGMDLLNESGYRYLEGPLVVKHEGETIRMRLWWSVDRSPEFDYSIGTYLMFGRTVIDQVDGPPQLVDLGYPPNPQPMETSRWQPGQYYVEEREVYLPALSGRSVNLWMAVYQWWDGTRIPAPGVQEDLLLHLARITVNAW